MPGNTVKCPVNQTKDSVHLFRAIFCVVAFAFLFEQSATSGVGNILDAA